MERLQALVGVESELAYVAGMLRRFVQALHPPAVGACLVTCSDEIEGECAAVFQRVFADELLVARKPGFRPVFRSANLGARYEWGAIRVAEQHFAVPRSREAFKVMVLKINSHVGVHGSGEEVVYGELHSDGSEAACCGVLAALLQGGQLPALQQLREQFRFGGQNRLLALLDGGSVEPRVRSLAAAVVNARLQAQWAVTDLEQYRPETPTVYLIVPCVTLNRPELDTELVVGQYGVDWTEQTPKLVYYGLGDDPSQYAMTLERGRVRIHDRQWPPPSDAGN